MMNTGLIAAKEHLTFSKLMSIKKSFLESIPKSTQKYIFTNANEKEAIECLECLGIKEHFLHVYGSKFMGNHCKPEEEAFLKVLKDIDPENKLTPGTIKNPVPYSPCRSTLAPWSSSALTTSI